MHYQQGSMEVLKSYNIEYTVQKHKVNASFSIKAL